MSGPGAETGSLGNAAPGENGSLGTEASKEYELRNGVEFFDAEEGAAPDTEPDDEIGADD